MRCTWSKVRQTFREGWPKLRSLLWLGAPSAGGSFQHRAEFESALELAQAEPDGEGRDAHTDGTAPDP